MQTNKITVFKDRVDAGKQLSLHLRQFQNDTQAIVIALPRGGVIVGGVVAEDLHVPLDIISPRKIGAPHNPEFAIGAITETGEGIFSTETIDALGISKEYLEKEVAKEKKEALSRLQRFRKNRPPRNLAGKKVILVDDGVATGSTMFAAIKTIRKESPALLIVAIPVAPPDTLKKIEAQVDQLICLMAPTPFFAVGGFYEKFDQTQDEEVITTLNKFI